MGRGRRRVGEGRRRVGGRKGVDGNEDVMIGAECEVIAVWRKWTKEAHVV